MYQEKNIDSSYQKTFVFFLIHIFSLNRFSQVSLMNLKFFGNIQNKSRSQVIMALRQRRVLIIRQLCLSAGRHDEPERSESTQPERLCSLIVPVGCLLLGRVSPNRVGKQLKWSKCEWSRMLSELSVSIPRPFADVMQPLLEHFKARSSRRVEVPALLHHVVHDFRTAVRTAHLVPVLHPRHHVF